MQRCLFVLVVLFLALVLPLPAAAGMVRVVDVPDGRTIIVSDNGRSSTVTLGGVSFEGDEAADAAAYLKRLVLGQWVLVETGGMVYRSPDALFVNNEMARHAWRGIPGFVYLGTVDPGPAKARPRAAAEMPQAAMATAPLPKVSQQTLKRPHAVPNLPKRQGGVAKQQPGRG